MSVTVAAEWNELANRFYSKRDVYRMAWQGVDLRQQMVACAPYGGPIAMTRDQRKLLLLGSASTVPYITIYSSAGSLMSSFKFDRGGGKLVALGWSEEEKLVCVVEDGSVHQYTVHGQLIPAPASLGKECWDQGVLKAVISTTGVVALTATLQLWAIPDLKDPTPLKLPNPGLPSVPRCMEVVEKDGKLEVLLTRGGSLVAVNLDGMQDLSHLTAPASVFSIAVAPNASFVSVYTDDNRVLVFTSDYSKSLSEFQCEEDSGPDQMGWCGTDSVVCFWEAAGLLLLVGPYGESVPYSYPEHQGMVLIPECDGVRTCSNRVMEFLARVPDPLVALFGIGTTSPAALLLDAMDQFDQRLAKADESIRAIGPSLPEAVEVCLDAARHEWDPQLQTKLLRAAKYGRAFSRAGSRDGFYDTCVAIKVLNNVRRPEVGGIPLSFAQYEALTAEVLIGRLVAAHRHLAALRIATDLRFPEERVLLHWAETRMSTTVEAEDEEVLEGLVKKVDADSHGMTWHLWGSLQLSLSRNISYAALAASAHRKGRCQLAVALLNYEPVAGAQVPQLLAMGEREKGLAKAIESGDSELMAFAVLHVKESKPEVEALKLLFSKPAAWDLYATYARQQEAEVLKRMYATVGQPQGVAGMILRSAWAAGAGSGGPGARGSALGGVRLKLIEEAAQKYGQAKEYGFEARVCLEHAALLKAQQELEVVTGQPIFVDSSVSDTIRTCIALGNHRAAQKIRTDFRIPDKRFYWLKVRTLAAAKDWEALEAFSKGAKRPPGGFKPFVEACIEEGATTEAAKYIAKTTDPEERAKAYARIGMMAEATEAAAQAKDGELLRQLKSTFATQNNVATALFDSLREKLNIPGMQI